MNYCFIVNPASGRGKGKILGQRLKERLEQTSLDYQILTTSAPGEAIEMAKKATQSFEVVVAVGGDGTLNEVVNGLMGSNSVLGLIPVGSGNDFARAAEIPFQFEPALEILLRGRKRKIDVGKANERYFHNGLGVGFDAHAVYTSMNVKRLRGNAIYLYSVLRTLTYYRPVPLTIHLNDEVKQGDYFMLTVGNGVSLGGGFFLTPDAQIDDGLFDLCLIQNMPTFSILRNLIKVYSGKHKEDPRVEMLRTDRLVIEAAEPFAVHLDGELLSLNLKHLTVEIIPRGLEIIC